MKLQSPLAQEFLVQLSNRLAGNTTCDILNYLISRNLIPDKVIKRFVVVCLIEEMTEKGMSITQSINQISLDYGLSERSCWGIRNEFKNYFN